MFGSLLKRTGYRIIKADIAVIDSALPNKNPIGPRNSDLTEFTRKLNNFKYFTMYTMKPGKSAWFSHSYGISKIDFNDRMKTYRRLYPENVKNINYLSKYAKYQINLAYTYFLAETYTLLPFLEENKVPFVFLLNPGGAFGLNNKSSDNMLKEICSSKYFTKVIVNQKLFKDYLLNKKICNSQDIIFDFTGSVQFKIRDVVKKKFYKKDKQTFDICFVAAKYIDKGLDKGYDLFISAAKILAKKHSNMKFHIVGGFSEDDIDISRIKNAVTFHGYLPANSLPKFYSSMDIYVSPNRPSVLYEGHSDGFPLSAGAMYCGVCGLNADELHMNTEFGTDEVVIIKNQAADIVKKINYLYNNPAKLYSISKKGQKKAQILYDEDRHIQGRIKLFKEIIRERA